jgi:hypothetical protein
MNTWCQRSGAVGSVEPQRVQNCRSVPGDDSKRPIRSVPPSQRNPLDAPTTKLANAAPCALRHIEQ